MNITILYIYIERERGRFIRRPLDRGATRLRRICYILYPLSYVSFPVSCILYPLHPCILAFTSFYSCILYAAGCILYPGFSHLDVGVWPQNRPDYHHLASSLSLGSLQGGSQNSSKFQPVPRTLQNHKNGAQGL